MRVRNRTRLYAAAVKVKIHAQVVAKSVIVLVPWIDDF